MLLSSGANFTIKTSCKNSGTPEPATSPVISHFPHPPNFRGHNSEKCGTEPELFNDFRQERMRVNIAMLRRPKAGWDVVWDTSGTGWGIFQHPPREASGIKRNSTEQKHLVQRLRDYRVIRRCTTYHTIPNTSPMMPIIHELIVRNPISPIQETAPITGTSAGYCRYSEGNLNAAMFAIK
jgi:hypothetical protein